MLAGKALRLGCLCLDWFSRAGVVCFHQWHIDEMLRQEPDLELVGSNDFADDEVVGAVVAGVGGLLGQIGRASCRERV